MKHSQKPLVKLLQKKETELQALIQKWALEKGLIKNHTDLSVKITLHLPYERFKLTKQKSNCECVLSKEDWQIIESGDIRFSDKEKNILTLLYENGTINDELILEQIKYIRRNNISTILSNINAKLKKSNLSYTIKRGSCEQKRSRSTSITICRKA